MLAVQSTSLFPPIGSSGHRGRDAEGDLNILSSSSVRKMAITPKSSPPKKIAVSPPSPKNSPGKKGRVALFGDKSQGRGEERVDREERGDRKGASSHLSPVRRHSASTSSSGADKKSIEEVVRANLKSMRDASSSANAKVRKFDVNNIARTAVKTMRSSKIRASLDGMVKNYDEDASRPKITQVYGAGSSLSSSAYFSNKTKRSGIPRSLSMKALDKNNSGSGSEREEESPKGETGALAPWSARGSNNNSTSDFQAACKARVLKKQKEMLARFKEQTMNLPQDETSRQESQRLRREETAMKDKERHRKRKEIYAVNAYLKQQEQLKFKLFLKEQKEAELEAAARTEKEQEEGEGGSGGQARDARDDVSWCSNDSSLMPTPRYRNEKERNYQTENLRKAGESSASESDSERSGNGGGIALSRRSALRQSVGGGV